ncbi:hypothetical protein M422DRAFT_29739 [Sphaerobolus stellatus SS14]|uniref:Zn(2)-C6 fungal-type domain-containing protein n=1 Tax=Sphaerobolus stellatus (strain SS14) TaxID=990650 RepID=A0A0C9VF25_SPHS4|nr:hypothetical protein M422DRAFT_29739 [Sphaerobolus stellatus SS14]
MSSPTEGTVICPVCLTNFTRKTHLDRHLRAHLDQRIYACTNCNKASFTRSDLLTRHVRRCTQTDKGKAASRKRSCEACIQRKIKCDLQQPCSKCASRGDTCIYNVPLRASTGNADQPQQQAEIASTSRASTVFTGQDSPSNVIDSSLLNAVDSPSDEVDSWDELRNLLQILPSQPGELPSLPSSSTNLPDMGNIDPTFMTSPPFGGFPGLLPQDYETAEMITNPDFHQPGPQQGNTIFDEFVWFDESSNSDSIGNNIPQDSTSSTPGPLDIPNESTQTITDEFIRKQYVSHFIRVHCSRYPFLHLPTWSESNTHPLFRRVMVACGSLYAPGKNLADQSARLNIVEEVLHSDVRHQIFRAFLSLPANDIDNQIQLFLAILNVQILGKFHWDPIERGVSAGHHGITIAMLKQSGLLAYYANWRPPSASTLHHEDTWKSWTRYETTKRIVLLCYLHDALMPVFFNLTCILQENEIEVRFPCTDTLWNAPNAEQWSLLATTTGAYENLRGRTVLSTAQILVSPSLPAAPMDAFESFVMIHFILRVLHYTSKLQAEDKRQTIQHLLAQWFHARHIAPLTTDLGNFTCVALPLYWLALRIQEERNTGALPSRGEQRFDIVKKWLWEFWPILRVEREAWLGYVPPEKALMSGAKLPTWKGMVDWIPISLENS